MSTLLMSSKLSRFKESHVFLAQNYFIYKGISFDAFKPKVMTLTVRPNVEIIAERREVSELMLSRTAIPTGVRLCDVREV